MKLFRSEPYKVHFILGALCSGVGVGTWILFYFGVISEYPIKMHSQLMILGFLFSFVSGFLMTAIPRMTGTDAATTLEKVFTSTSVLSFLISTLLGLQLLAFLASTIQFALLIVFLFRRLVRMKERKLPSGFIFIPIGLVSGLIGSSLTFMANYGNPEFLGMGRLFLYEGFILNLIIGLGSRLIPVLTRKAGALSPTDIKVVSNRLFLMEALVFNSSFFVEYFVNVQIGIAIRCIAMCFVLYKNFHFFSPMIEKSNLGLGILVSSIAMPISYFLILIAPSYRGHLIHIIYILSLALLTFLVSVRVSLAHGGASLDLERSANSILVMISSFVVAMTIRVFGSFFAGSFIIEVYAVGGVFFILGLTTWAYFLRNTLFARLNEEQGN